MPFEAVVPAAVVLYQPDGQILNTLLTALDHGQRRIFVYVNGPVDASIEARVATLANACVIRDVKNVGLGTGLNVLASAAMSEGFSHLQLFDQDSTPDPGLPAALMARWIEIARESPRIAAIGPCLTTPAGEHFRANRYAWRDRSKGTVDFAPTSGAIISLAVWRAIGPFRADYFIGGIDVEWCLRAWHYGYASLISASTPMVHRWGTDVAAGERWKPQILRQSDARNYLYIRNAVDTLRLGFIPLGWRMRFAARLSVQIALLLLLACEGPLSKRRLLRRALCDGWHGRLGPLPSEFSTS